MLYRKRRYMDNIIKVKSYIKDEGLAALKDLFSKQEFLFLNSEKYTVLPGFADVHVHFREPGFSYKESIKTGSLAAARGGYTAVCTMPNLDPVPDSLQNLKLQQDIIDRDACIAVLPYGALTVGEKGEIPSDIDGMADKVVAFSDDGKGVQSESMMRSLMEKVKKHSKILAAHCEDNSLLRGGYIHDGEYARLHGHKGICGESEWGQIKRDLKLAKETGCAYHVCHISCKESVELIRNAKKEGVDVTCETAPHYLLMNDMMLREDGKFKMNPPIRSESDREALINGLLDGTVDMIATDHAPHSREEKSNGLAGSAFGIVGLETSFPLLYTELVKKNIINMEKLLDLMCYKPRKRFGIKTDTGFSFWALGDAYIIDPEDFLSKGRATPFEGRSVFGRCVMTVYDGKPVYGE